MPITPPNISCTFSSGSLRLSNVVPSDGVHVDGAVDYMNYIVLFLRHCAELLGSTIFSSSQLIPSFIVSNVEFLLSISIELEYRRTSSFTMPTVLLQLFFMSGGDV